MGITVSPQHGVNPSVELCFFCQEEKSVVLFGRLQGDMEAPRRVTLNREPCPECQGYMDQGVIFISVRDPGVHGDDPKNPYRTGGWVVLKEEGVRRCIAPEELVQHVLKTRVAFVPDHVWDAIGLPRHEDPAKKEQEHAEEDA